jgi:hypothetical protein
MLPDRQALTVCYQRRDRGSARPSPVGVDLLHTGVVVIEMQNDFAAPGGMFDDAVIDLGWRTFSW